jgi:adenylate kinase family enzyme
MGDTARAVGRRVLVDGMAGSGKSTFSRALSQKTGLPVIHLDIHYWQPGWVKPSADAWRETQRNLLRGDAWIADGNDLETLELRLERADTFVLLDTPWWTCASRAFRRGLVKPIDEMPSGCPDSFWRRLRDEWRLVGEIVRNRRSEHERTLEVVAESGQQAALHVLGSRRETQGFLRGLSDDN